jgi:hypothetical protein
MKNLNQEGLNELSQEEAKQIDGGNWRDTVNGLIDKTNDWLEERHVPITINYI